MVSSTAIEAKLVAVLGSMSAAFIRYICFSWEQIHQPISPQNGIGSHVAAVARAQRPNSKMELLT